MSKLIHPSKFTELASQASQEFLEKGTDLTDSIVKIAELNSLTPGQIGQVCQQANVLTYEHLFKTAEDKTFQFPLADSKKVVEQLTPETETVTPANELIDYLTDPPAVKVAKTTEDYMRAFGVTEMSNEPQVHEKVAQAKKLRVNIESARDEIERQIIDNHHVAEQIREKVAHEMRQVILSDDDGRLAGLQKVAKVVWHGVASDRLGLALIEIHKIASKFAEQGMFGEANRRKDLRIGYQRELKKEAHGNINSTGRSAIVVEFIEKTAEKVQDDLISKTMLTGSASPMDKVVVVNGNHPMIMEINTLVNQVSEEDRLKQGLNLLEDKAGYVVKKISDINTTQTTDKYVQDETGDRPQIPDEPGTKLRRFQAGVY